MTDLKFSDNIQLISLSRMRARLIDVTNNKGSLVMIENKVITQEVFSENLQEKESTQQSDPIENTVPIKKDKKETENLEELVFTHKKLSQIKANLNAMIDAMAQNPSLFTRAANFWGEIPIWQKIVGGILLIIPTLLIGIFAQLAVFIAISIVTLIVYTASSVVLDDHFNHKESSTESLKTGMAGMADALGKIILSLEAVHKDLASAVEAFTKENERLTNSIGQLNNQIETFSLQAELLQQTEQLLRTTQNELEKTALTLSISVQEKTDLLHESQMQLEKIKADFKANQCQLSEKIEELSSTVTAMGLENKRLEVVCAILEDTTKKLSSTTMPNEKDRTAFTVGLDAFLSDKKGCADLVAQRIYGAERELVLVKKELERSNQRHEMLLNDQGKLIDRLEELAKINTKTPSVQQSAPALKTLGQFALPTISAPPHEQNSTFPTNTMQH